MEPDLSIGQFARLTHLSAKTLHHYHEQEVLIPGRVHPTSGYRYYRADQAPTAQLVRRLRELEVPLAAVRAVLRAGTLERDRLLGDHLERMRGELERRSAIVTSLEALLREPAPQEEAEERELAPVRALVRRAMISPHEAASWVGSQLDQLDAVAQANGWAAHGPGTATFASSFFTDGLGEVAALLPLAESGTAAESAEQLAGGRFLVAVHRGSYLDLDRTYGVLGACAHRLGRAASGPIRERYVVDYAQVDDEEALRTEVCWPIR